MRKEIILSGMTSAPYDDQAPDGQTSLLSGVEIHNNAVRNTQIGGTKYDVGDNDLIFVHVTSDNKTIFILKGTDGYIKWKDRDSDNAAIQNIYNPGEDIEIQAVNNTLVFLSKNNPIRYALWNSNSYKYLGELPDLDIDFSLHNYFSFSESFSTSVNYNRDNKGFLGTDLNAIIYSYTSNTIESRKYFYYPFYVRAAIRLYDGSLIKYSQICLMEPNLFDSPRLLLNDLDVTSKDYIKMYTYMSRSKLIYKIKNDFSGWSDIITSIDIFISPQINTMQRYDEGVYKGLEVKTVLDTHVMGKLDVNSNRETVIVDEPKLVSLSEFVTYYNSISLCVLNPEKLIKDSLNSLYLFHSNKIQKITPEEWEEITPEESTIDNISQKEKMEFEYNSRDIIYPKFSFTYNKRLIISNIKIKKFVSFSPQYILPYVEGNYNDDSTTSLVYKLYASIEYNGDKKTIYCGESKIYDESLYYTKFIFCPNPNVTALTFIDVGLDLGQEIENGSGFTFEMEPHPLLNGSYYFRSSYSMPDKENIEIPESLDFIVEMPNTIYTSETSNPFLFPVEGVTSVGNGNIIALASLSKELSPSQFGQYPLVALCSDGNYALKVTSEGLYTEPSLMQSEICSNKNTVTQLKGSIVFSSKRGLMLMDGSDIICISEVLDGPIDKLTDEFYHLQESFISYLENAQISYDYYQDRILVINPEIGYIYIYNLSNASWSVHRLRGSYKVINAFPFSYIQYRDKSILMLDKYYEFKDTIYTGYIITRPLKLDTFQYKRINSFSVEGLYLSEAHPFITVTIYGSNDNKTWHMLGNIKLTNKGIGRIRGRYFKFFRFKLGTTMMYTDHITGLIIDYDTKQDSRLR